MNSIFSHKNLTKKISIFFLVFFILLFSSIKISSAEILHFGFGADTTTCKDVLANCKINSSLKKDAVGNPNYKLVNTEKNLNADLTTDYQVTDFNISLDDFIKTRLIRGDTGYFETKIDDNFDYFSNDFLSYENNLSDSDKKNLALLDSTINANVTTGETKLATAKNVTKNLANTTDSAFDYEYSRVGVLTYYYLKIYKVLDQYLIINKAVLSADAQKQLTDLKDNLRKNIYTYLYKSDAIVRADGCTTDGTNLEKCDLFVSGKFKVEASGTAPDLEFNVTTEVNNLKLDASKYDANANIVKIDTSIVNADPNTRNNYTPKECDKAIDISWWFSIDPYKSTDGCSFVAISINYVIQGINGLVNIVVNLVGAIFDWIYDNGVINFKSLVDGSGAYTIYKTIILSLIVSVMMFFVFYLIIRRLIDDDGEKMNKILPGLILTALFVYFSFTITGWIIDQSNIITIYLYRSMTHQDGAVQSIGEVFKRILNLDNSGVGTQNIADNFGISKGTWDAIPYTLGQLAVSIVGVFVLFEGAILILSRTIILLLCMIFSPLMLLPDGLTDFTDKYKKLVMDNFTGNVLLGPVFMFLVLIAVQIGQITTKMVGTGPVIPGGGPANTAGFLGGIISSVLVIVVLQLAISVSKSLSGSMGEKLSGVISKYAGGAAFGGGAKVLRNTIGRGAAIAKDKGWMMGKEGSTRHKFMSTLYNGAAKSTFDARNTSGFQQAADLSGAGAASFGKGSSKNYNDSFKAKLYNANKYHGGLDESGKQRNITRLKNSVDIDNQRIAESLDKKWKPSINERLNNDSDYSKRFDKAHNEKDQTKRKTETEKIVNEHFKENGQGAEHFSKEIQKAENNKIKQDYDKALAEKDPEERKKQLTKVIADLDKKTSPNEGSVPSLTESLEAAEVQNDNSDFEEENTINKKQGRVQRLLNNQLLNKTEGSLSGLRNENLMNSFNKVNQKMNEQTKQIAEDEQTRLKEEEQLRINTTPTAQDLSAQTSLKNKLQAKWTPEKIKAYSEEVEKKANDKSIAKSIERNKSKRSDDNDEPNDDEPSTPSPTGSGKPEIGNSMSVNETGRLRPMYSPEEIATLNKNRESGGEGDKKVA